MPFSESFVCISFCADMSTGTYATNSPFTTAERGVPIFLPESGVDGGSRIIYFSLVACDVLETPCAFCNAETWGAVAGISVKRRRHALLMASETDPFP